MKKLRVNRKSLITNKTTILNCSKILLPLIPSWKNTFKRSINELSIISDLIEKRKIHDEYYYPDTRDIFKAFELTPLNKVRVVIFDTDPQTTGLCYSILKKDDRPTNSLNNIFKELNRVYNDYKNNNDLTYWALQGVLLLSISLTYPKNKPKGHFEYFLWMPFIVKVLEDISKVRPNCIYILWGKDVEIIKDYILGNPHILEYPKSLKSGILGCNHFIMVNDILKQLNEQQIRW